MIDVGEHLRRRRFAEVICSQQPSSPLTPVPRLSKVMSDGDDRGDAAIYTIDDVIGIPLFEKADSMTAVDQWPAFRCGLDVMQRVGNRRFKSLGRSFAPLGVPAQSLFKLSSGFRMKGHVSHFESPVARPDVELRSRESSAPRQNPVPQSVDQFPPATHHPAERLPQG